MTYVHFGCVAFEKLSWLLFLEAEVGSGAAIGLTGLNVRVALCAHIWYLRPVWLRTLAWLLGSILTALLHSKSKGSLCLRQRGCACRFADAWGQWTKACNTSTIAWRRRKKRACTIQLWELYGWTRWWTWLKGFFNLTHGAKCDLTSIAAYTQHKWGRERRVIYLRQLDDAFHLLAVTPDIGKACDDVKLGYRKFPVYSHIIFYREVTQAQIDVIPVLHKNGC